ncbi:MAG: hypothetical protein NC409_09165 [Clostridium sp.]|nr:hypothetical protein [Clostridium sp.]
MEQQGYFVSCCGDGYRKILYSENIEIFENWRERSVEIINGIPVVRRRTDTDEKETWQGKEFSGYCTNKKHPFGAAYSLKQKNNSYRK